MLFFFPFLEGLSHLLRGDVILSFLPKCLPRQDSQVWMVLFKALASRMLLSFGKARYPLTSVGSTAFAVALVSFTIFL